MEPAPEMSASALAELLGLFEAAGIPVWLDGGWGVDALLGTQTRPHKDVDIVLPVRDVPRLRELLAERGFEVVAGKPPDSFVLADGAGLEVDVHAATFRESGDGVYRMQNGEDWVYTAAYLGGEGLVGGRPVRCLTPEAQVVCHAYGYTLAEKDYRDMELLAGRFRLELPPQLRRDDAQHPQGEAGG
ncbi:MAG: nucleotidyltransferase family protein [Acidobacteria bacterium]|nr:nucleotidyltransferase family protein [Acidobacteriota bacterium]